MEFCTLDLHTNVKSRSIRRSGIKEDEVTSLSPAEIVKARSRKLEMAQQLFTIGKSRVAYRKKFRISESVLKRLRYGRENLEIG
jgi:hypothetical protein